MRWSKGSTEGSITVGGNGKGNQSNHLIEKVISMLLIRTIIEL